MLVALSVDGEADGVEARFDERALFGGGVMPDGLHGKGALTAGETEVVDESVGALGGA